MKNRKKLILKKEKIAELSSEESAQIKGGGALPLTSDPPRCDVNPNDSHVLAGCGATVTAPEGELSSYAVTCNSMALNC